MKKILKQRGFYAVLAAAALVTAAFVMTCINPVDITSLQGKEDFQIPEGKGLIRLVIAEPARTVMPDIDLSTLYFTVNATAGVYNNDEVDKGAYLSSYVFPLPAGNYTITVVGYSDSAGTKQVVTGATTTPIGVTVGNPSSTTITLNPNKATGTGIIAWDIDITGIGTATATLDIYSYGTTVSAIGGAITLAAGTRVGSEDGLTTGVYRAVITTTRAGYLTKTISRIIHVYENATSTLDDIAVVSPTTNLTYTITYNLNGDTDPLFDPSTGDTTAQHGSLITFPGDPSGTLSFGGWMRAAPQTSVLWDEAVDLIVGNLTLYAKWVGTTGEMTVSITLADIDDLANVTPTAQTLSLGTLNGSNVLTFTFDGTGFSSIIWRINGAQYAPANGLATLSVSNTSTFVADMVPGEKIEISVEATHTDTKQYGAEIEITVTP